MIFYKLKLFISKNLTSFWYWLMKPLAYFFTTEKIDARYNKKKGKITEEQAIKWIAEDMVRHIIKRKHNGIQLLICDNIGSGDFWSDCTLTNKPYYIRRNKSRMAYYKFKWNVELQLKVIEQLYTYKDIVITDEVETFNSWQNIKNYQKTINVRKKGE